MLIAALLVMTVSANADEFADVDPERLAKGIEILAAKWTIPIVVFHGATDDFAKSDPDEKGGTGATPSFPAISSQAAPASACPTDQVRLRDRYRYGTIVDCLPGAIERRRD